MRNQKFFRVCLSILLLPTFAQATLGQSLQKRDLARYDNGGTFDFNWDLMPDVHETMKRKLRVFLWEHWNQKKLGRVVATFYTLEGDPTTANLYIESDASGRWRTVSEYESECCALYAFEKKKRKPKRKRGVEIYDTVEWVEPIKSGVTWRVIPEGDRQEPGAFRLRFRRMGPESKSSDTAFVL